MRHRHIWIFTRAHNDRTRGKSFKLKMERFRLEVMKKFFTQRVVRHWTGCPQKLLQLPHPWQCLRPRWVARWAAWFSGWHSCPWLGSWHYMIFKVPSAQAFLWWFHNIWRSLNIWISFFSPWNCVWEKFHKLRVTLLAPQSSYPTQLAISSSIRKYLICACNHISCFYVIRCTLFRNPEFLKELTKTSVASNWVSQLFHVFIKKKTKQNRGGKR